MAQECGQGGGQQRQAFDFFHPKGESYNQPRQSSHPSQAKSTPHEISALSPSSIISNVDTPKKQDTNIERSRILF